MTALWVTWPLAAVVIVGLAGAAGWAGTRQWSGVLMDERGRYSLTRLQMTAWTTVIVSLLAAVTAARISVSGIDPLDFSIPTSVLVAVGISLGSGVVTGGIKAVKDRNRADFIAAVPPGAQATADNTQPRARLAQVVLYEEGPSSDQAVDITKFQNLLFTVLLLGSYVAITIHAFLGNGPAPAISGPAGITSLQEFNTTFIALLATSHAGYIAGKVPNRGGVVTAPMQAGARPLYSMTDRVSSLAIDRSHSGPDQGPLPTIRTLGAPRDLERLTLLEGRVDDLQRATRKQ